MTTIMILSNELIDVILRQENVSIKDVVNFGLTCTRFLAVINNNMLWQKKIYQRWPCLKRIYDKRIQEKEDINFKDELKANIKCRNELREYLSLMSEMFFHKNGISDVDLVHSDFLFCPTLGAHTMNYYFVMDELMYLIEMSSLLPNCNLTHKYYSKKLLRYVHQRHLKDIWEEFISYPKEQQLLERAAFIVAQWYQSQKFIFYLDMEASLDNIAQQVLEGLKNTHCNHPIFSTSAKQFSFWKYNINDNQWSRKEEKQILDVLRTVLFDILGFHGPMVPDSNPKAEHILIDCVLETKVGNAISLAIIFQSVARRLGLRCDLVCFPTHFFLSWKPRCDDDTENLEDEEYFYIDILHGGLIRSKNDCPVTRGRRCPIENFNEPNKITPTEIVLRMINSLQMVNPNYQHYQDRAVQIRSLVEFRYMIEPYNIDAIENLCRHYLQYGINTLGLINPLHRLLNSYNDETSVEARRAEILLKRCELDLHDNEYLHFSRQTSINTGPRERSLKIKYAVGMIMKCNSFANHMGVIIWWDEKYNRNVRIEYGNRILYSLSHQPHSSASLNQPFYVILTENGNLYYAAQDTLVEANPPRWIEHNEIGRYFCRFAQSHYVPNNMLTKYFLYDINILKLYASSDHPFSS